MQIPHDNQRDNLKDYVQKHPNNKMAWYLLGRDYAERGEIAKAKYCFIQAGEIYEAYEDNPSPEILAAQKVLQAQQEDDARAAAEAGERQRRGGAAMGQERTGVRLDETAANKPKKAARIVRGTVIWLFLLFLIGPATNALENDQAAVVSPLPPAEQQPALSGTAPAQPVPAASAAERRPLAIFYAASGQPAASPGKLTAAEADGLLAPLIREAIGGVPVTMLVQPALLKAQWVDWLAKPKVLYSVEKTPDTSGAYKLTAYDHEVCTCEPSDPSAMDAQYGQWKSTEEQKLIVQSAIEAYRQQAGALPESLHTLIQSYPNNVLPGVTPEMQRIAASLLGPSALPAAQQGGAKSPPAVALPPNTPAQSVPSTALLNQPLEILIDKTTHRLAVVSGNVILRSYPVGLGGARTPEGEFTISEKVRNPNGRDNGDFGSRGMTLSDTNYAIHGTNQPTSIGADRSLGCVRMLKGDVEELFDMVPKGTKVKIGRNMLPSEIRRSEKPYQAPVQAEETNPGKVYKWLN